MTSPRCQSYSCKGLLVHRDRIGPGEIFRRGGIEITKPDRIAFDLARRAPTLTERVAAVDALAYNCKIDLADVMMLRHRHLGARHGGEVAEVLRLADRRAESPMESRARMALVLGGMPPLAVQYPVVIRGRRYYLDLAYPEQRIAIEYDGADHRTQQRARRDLEREAALVSAGWRILRFDAYVVLFEPERIVAEVRAKLAAAA